MELRAQDIANLTGGQIDGQPDIVIENVAKLEEAGPKSLCFFSNPKYEEQLYKTAAAVVFVPRDFKPAQMLTATLIRHDNPYYGFCQVLAEWFNPNTHKTGVEAGSFISPDATLGKGIYVGATAYVDEGAVIGDNCSIYPGVFIGRGAVIGSDTVLYSGVKIYSNCEIGSNCIVHSNTVIGSDGFGFAPVGGSYVKIPQVGNVVIEDHVEIGAGCTIDRATMGSTIIRRGTKLDNLIQVAHNAEIGSDTVIAAQAGISGSTKIGNHCQIGGQSGFVGHISIADGVGIAAQSGVSKAITESGTNWMGSPAVPIKDYFKSQVVFKNLANLQKTVNDLEHKIKKEQ